MSLTEFKDGSITLSKERAGICIDAAWELEALAVCAQFVAGHIEGSSLFSQSVACDSPEYAELQALHGRVRRVD